MSSKIAQIKRLEKDLIRHRKKLEKLIHDDGVLLELLSFEYSNQMQERTIQLCYELNKLTLERLVSKMQSIE